MRLFLCSPSRNIFFALKLLFVVTIHPCAQAAKENIPLVTAQKIQLSETAETLIYPAKIESKIHTVVLADADGVVRNMMTLGSEIKRGTTVLTIRNSDPVYQYAPVQIKSPIQGVLSETFVTEGSQVMKGDKLATIIDPEQIRLAVEIPNADLVKIKKGQKGSFLLNNNNSEENTEVQVLGVSPLVNNLTGTATAILGFKGKTHFKAGTLGKVEFKILAAQQVLVDENAVIYRNAQPFVRVIEAETAKYRAVTLGARQSGQIVIEKGLDIGEVIVKKSSQYIPENKKVKVQE